MEQDAFDRWVDKMVPDEQLGISSLNPEEKLMCKKMFLATGIVSGGLTRREFLRIALKALKDVQKEESHE